MIRFQIRLASKRRCCYLTVKHAKRRGIRVWCSVWLTISATVTIPVKSGVRGRSRPIMTSEQRKLLALLATNSTPQASLMIHALPKACRKPLRIFSETEIKGEGHG
jgi:hypothetical protein